MSRLLEIVRNSRRILALLEMVAIVGFLVVGACSTEEKTVVRTVIDIAKALCTPADTLDACVDKILSDKRVGEARAAARRQ